MVMPTLHAFNRLGELMVHKYERYLPTAFDESMSLLEKVNKIIDYLNETGRITNDIVEQWNEVMEWVMNEKLGEDVSLKLEEMANNGVLEKIINADLLGSKVSIVVSDNEPTNFDQLTFWFEDKGENDTDFRADNSSSGDIIVSDNEPSDTTKIWYDVE